MWTDVRIDGTSTATVVAVAVHSPEVDILPIRDPALNPSTPVRRRPELLLPRHAMRAIHERVVVLASGERRSPETRADLETLGRRDGEHRVREHSLQLVEGRLAESERAVTDYAGDGATQRVVAGLSGANDLNRG
jgi:hypothetical protein